MVEGSAEPNAERTETKEEDATAPSDSSMAGRHEVAALSTMDRRKFLTIAGAGALIAGPTGAAAAAPLRPAVQSPEIIVIGAGAFGGWTALHLARHGARVRLIDTYGPGNSRSTSGDETRGVRSSYGDRAHGELWCRWATRAIQEWQRWDEEWNADTGNYLFYQTGDVICREEDEPYLEETRKHWDSTGVNYEVLTPEEVHYRWPRAFGLEEIGIVLYEPQAGVVRARRTCEIVAGEVRKAGGEVMLARARTGRSDGRRLLDVSLSSGDTAAAQIFVFACGPWMPKVFPDIFGNRMRTPVGNVCYYGTPPGDVRFIHPNLPSWSFPGVTGWPALMPDYRGFRVRTGGGRNPDPDSSERYVDWRSLARPREILRQRFPDLEDAPLLQTHACHYELSVSRNFVLAPHPDWDNVWLAGGGSAEGFKFAPVIGEYMARRVLGIEDDPELAKQFAIPEETYEEQPR
jgi:sarcosine oxidase